MVANVGVRVNVRFTDWVVILLGETQVDGNET